MCTVSFVSKNGKTIITHNRDEQIARESAIEPKLYSINGKNLYFPKDPKAGGTWYAVSQNQTVLVLLNGAKEKHQQLNSYRKSRGLIVLDLISSDSAIQEWEIIDLQQIEPFTIVLFQDNKLYQLRWDYYDKSTLNLDINSAHIWSSSTLYPEEVQQKRTEVFTDFMKRNSEIEADDLLQFHSQSDTSDPENTFVMNRNDFLKTLSITQTVINASSVSIFYRDLQSQKNHEIIFDKN